MPTDELLTPSFEIFVTVAKKIRLKSFRRSIGPSALHTKLLFN